MNRNYTISFCTVVKNRLDHIRRTLPRNIEDNSDFQNAQFVILDYNSKDGLSHWVKSELSTFIKSGKLVYYYTPEPEFFNRSHSRNMVMKLSEGDIICNVDADNFIGKGFAEFISNEFANKKNIFLSAYNEEIKNMPRDVIGRICFKKEDFYLIEGFDERMSGYGFEDHDFINRLKLAGLENKIITDYNFLKAISHSNQERISEEKSYKTFYKLFISHVSFSKTDIIVLFKTGEFNSGSLIDYNSLYSCDLTKQRMYSHLEYEFGLEKESWESGSWEEKNNHLRLASSNRENKLYRLDKNYLCLGKRKFVEVLDKDLITDFLLFYSEFGNRTLLKSKSKDYTSNVTKGEYGKGIVYCNFDDRKRIII